MDKPLFLKGDTVRHHLYGLGRILSVGYYTATVRFRNGAEMDITTSNLTLEPR